jgi:DNA-binding response OmpR family regulator
MQATLNKPYGLDYIMHRRNVNAPATISSKVQKTILVAENNAKSATLIRNTFAKAGYMVFLISDIAEALEISAKRWIDLAIVNLDISSQDSILICRELRQIAFVPVIAFTTNDGTSHQLKFLIEEADDYLATPFSSNELLARAKLVLHNQRRESWRRNIVTVGDLILDRVANVVLIDKTVINLTPNECQLLNYLMHKPGQTVRKGEIIRAVWQSRFYNDSNALRVTIRRLRHKIEQNPSQPGYLLTVYGVGYKLRTAEQLGDSL